MKNKSWQARFQEENDALLISFNSSLSFDKRLYEQDIKASLIHAKMLGAKKIISKEDLKSIEKGLLEIKKEIKTNNFVFKDEDEDIHMACEHALAGKIGKEIAGRLHTARSRNDQVATDFKLFVNEANEALQKEIKLLMKRIVKIAKKHTQTIMPGFTHLQNAQPISFAFYILSFAFMFQRDVKRLENSLDLASSSPLGASALAGTSYDIDRNVCALELGFKAPCENAMDAVSDRDFALDFLYNISLTMTHASRLCEDLIIYSSSQFSFVSLSDAYSTGSSIMPQKKNPDSLELVRGKSGRCYGNLLALLTTLKALPLAYNKDMQEDKERVFDSYDTALLSLRVLREVLKGLSINKENMLKACQKGHLLATDLADYLVIKKNLPFRQAHFIVGAVVKKAEEKGLDLSEIEDLREYDDIFDKQANKLLNFKNSLNSKLSQGSSSIKSVQRQILILSEFLRKRYIRSGAED